MTKPWIIKMANQPRDLAGFRRYRSAIRERRRLAVLGLLMIISAAVALYVTVVAYAAA